MAIQTTHDRSVAPRGRARRAARPRDGRRDLRHKPATSLHTSRHTDVFTCYDVYASRFHLVHRNGRQATAPGPGDLARGEPSGTRTGAREDIVRTTPSQETRVRCPPVQQSKDGCFLAVLLDRRHRRRLVRNGASRRRRINVDGWSSRHDRQIAEFDDRRPRTVVDTDHATVDAQPAQSVHRPDESRHATVTGEDLAVYDGQVARYGLALHRADRHR